MRDLSGRQNRVRLFVIRFITSLSKKALSLTRSFHSLELTESTEKILNQVWHRLLDADLPQTTEEDKHILMKEPVLSSGLSLHLLPYFPTFRKSFGSILG